MKINRVTITGADDSVNPQDLYQLSLEFPFVEWGLLFSQNKQGQPRYPDISTINRFCVFGIRLSAHFCGIYAKEILENKKYSLLYNILPQFQRIQLNYNFKNLSGFDLKSLNSHVGQFNATKIILQYNESNKPVLDELMNSPEGMTKNIHLLWDGSGGKGVQIQHILKSFNNYTGYSGGINENNVEAICDQIKRTHGNENVWIDIETGARTNDQFDLVKVRNILEKVKPFISTVHVRKAIIKNSKDGKFCFILVAGNGEPIAISETYEQKKSAIEICIKHFPDFIIQDTTIS